MGMARVAGKHITTWMVESRKRGLIRTPAEQEWIRFNHDKCIEISKRNFKSETEAYERLTIALEFRDDPSRFGAEDSSPYKKAKRIWMEHSKDEEDFVNKYEEGFLGSWQEHEHIAERASARALGPRSTTRRDWDERTGAQKRYAQIPLALRSSKPGIDKDGTPNYTYGVQQAECRSGKALNVFLNFEEQLQRHNFLHGFESPYHRFPGRSNKLSAEEYREYREFCREQDQKMEKQVSKVLSCLGWTRQYTNNSKFLTEIYGNSEYWSQATHVLTDVPMNRYLQRAAIFEPKSMEQGLKSSVVTALVDKYKGPAAMRKEICDKVITRWTDWTVPMALREMLV